MKEVKRIIDAYFIVISDTEESAGDEILTLEPLQPHEVSTFI